MEGEERMTAPETVPHHLVMTKLHIPENPFCLVVRERLHDKLSYALRCKLTLVVAPAGYGKTTLVSSWLRDSKMRYGWVSLDQGEDDRLRFWNYVAEALLQSLPEEGDESAGQTGRLSSPFTDGNISSWLIARLSTRKEPVMLVLDDYHLIESGEVHSDLHTWMEHLPAYVHVVLLSRQNIPFPVGAMRAKANLLEIDMTELRFTEEEIGTFWTGRTGKEPGDSLLRDLSRNTEGWAAMLQLAALSHSAIRPDTREPLSGRHRHVVDYLMEEMFGQLPGEMRRFLISTSILERMNDSLCAAVMNEPDVPSTLYGLERKGLFLIALDHERCWYRYHHLFADFLHNHLSTEGVPDAAVLHARAAKWFEDRGYIAEAIQHALAAGAFGQAADLMEKHASIWLKRRETATLLSWFDRLSEETANRPLLLLLRMWTELMAGLTGRAYPRFAKLKASLEQWKETEEPGLLARLHEEIQIFDNACAVLSGDFERSLALMRLLSEREDMPPEHVPVTLGHGIELNEGTVPFIRGQFGFKGRIRQAELYHRSYGVFLAKNGLQEYPYSAYQQAALSEVLYERNELDAAHEAATEAIRLGWSFGVLGAYVPAVISLAGVLEAMGRREDSIERVKQALQSLESRHLYTTHWFDKLTAKRIRQSLTLGDIESAQTWVETWKTKAPEDYTLLSDYERLTYIQALLVLGRVEEAGVCARQLLQAAQQSGNRMSELQALLASIELHWRGLRTEEGFMCLRDALQLGEKEGYMRSFLDASKTVLKAIVLGSGDEAELEETFGGVSFDYVRAIVSASGITPGRVRSASMKESRSNPPSRPDALTPKEREVLQLMSKGLSNKEIAAALFVTEGTVKLHLHHIYSKLQTSGRVQTLRAAEQLGLLRT